MIKILSSNSENSTADESIVQYEDVDANSWMQRLADARLPYTNQRTANKYGETAERVTHKLTDCTMFVANRPPYDASDKHWKTATVEGLSLDIEYNPAAVRFTDRESYFNNEHYLHGLYLTLIDFNASANLLARLVVMPNVFNGNVNFEPWVRTQRRNWAFWNENRQPLQTLKAQYQLMSYIYTPEMYVYSTMFTVVHPTTGLGVQFELSSDFSGKISGFCISEISLLGSS